MSEQKYSVDDILEELKQKESQQKQEAYRQARRYDTQSLLDEILGHHPAAPAAEPKPEKKAPAAEQTPPPKPEPAAAGRNKSRRSPLRKRNRLRLLPAGLPWTKKRCASIKESRERFALLCGLPGSLKRSPPSLNRLSLPRRWRRNRKSPPPPGQRKPWRKKRRNTTISAAVGKR